MLQSVTFVHVSPVGSPQVTQPAIVIGKVIVSDIIANKWYPGKYQEMSHSFLGMLQKGGGGTLVWINVSVVLLMYRCIRKFWNST